MRKCEQAQNAAGYLIFLGVVILVVLAFVRPGGRFRKAVERGLNRIPDQIEYMVSCEAE